MQLRGAEEILTGDRRTPSPLPSKPVVCLQGEEDVDDSRIVFLILLPRSLRQSPGWLTLSSNVAVLAEIENNTNLEHLAKRELELPFDLSPWGHNPPAGP